MAKELRRRISRRMTDEERTRHREIREQVASELPELMEQGRKAKAEHDVRAARLRGAVAELRSAREELGLSLSDIRDRTGIERSTLSRLENDEDANPTVATLDRHASAVGKEILIALVDLPDQSG